MIGVGIFYHRCQRCLCRFLWSLGLSLACALLISSHIVAQDPTGREISKPSKKTPISGTVKKNDKPPGLKPSPRKTAPAPRLTILAPPGALIEIDGAVKGFAGIDGNLVVLGIASGTHTLKASSIGYDDWIGPFSMGISATRFEVPIKKKPEPGKLAFTINEPDALVIVDGQERIRPQVGQPNVLSGLATGTHKIVARKRNFYEWNGSVSVEPGKISSVKITLKPLIDPEMLTISEGVFEMGNDTGDKDQRPKHQVFVPAFEISRIEITNRLYKKFVDEAGHQPPKGLGYGWHANQYPAGHDDFPVVFVSWDDVVAFCKWMSQESGSTYRLPTEAEWEKAAKLKSTPESLDEAKGKFLSAGKVWEWCSDWYDPDYYKLRDRINPQGPIVGKKVKLMGFEGLTKSMRGGGFGSGQVLPRATERNHYFPDKSRFDIGFRVVREIKQGASK